MWVQDVEESTGPRAQEEWSEVMGTRRQLLIEP